MKNEKGVYMKSFLNFLLIILIFSNFCFCEIGKVLKEIPLKINQPYGLEREKDFLLITDRETGKLIYFSLKKLEIEKEIKLPCKNPLGIAKSEKGYWVFDSYLKKLFLFDLKEEKVKKVLEDLEVEPFSLAYDSINLWATTRGKFLKVDPTDGTIIESFSGLSNAPEGIHFDGNYLWITDRLNDKIYCATKEGDIFGVLNSPTPYPAGIYRDKDKLYLLDFQKKVLLVLDISPSLEPFYTSNFKKRKITFKNSLCNKGPSSEVFGKIYFAIPKEDPHQKFLSEIKFFPQNYEKLKDKWNEEFAHLSGKIENDKCLEFSYSLSLETKDLNFFILPEWVKGLEEIPEEIKRAYLIDGTKLDITDEYIKDLVKKIIGNEKNPLWIAFKIHKYLHTNLSYERTGGWNKAQTILKRGSGSCSEFTFAFLALARAAGLPARYEAGIVVRGDDGSIDDVYHRWVQVYLPPFGWIPVDPSKGKPATILDVANSFGSLSNRFFITTHSGGDSEYLGWQYNSYYNYEYKGEAEVGFTSEAKWEEIK